MLTNRVSHTHNRKNPSISAIVSAGTNQLKAAQCPEGHNLPLSHTQRNERE